MFFKLVLIVSLLSVILNVRKIRLNTEAGCDSLAYAIFGVVGTVIALSYLFGGGIQ